MYENEAIQGRVRLWLYQLFATAISLSRTAIARAIAAATLTILRSVVGAIAQKYPDEEY